MKYDIKEIKQKVCIAIDILFKNDAFLLENNANERSVSHKLAEYLQMQFPDWNVDCEYNRSEDMIKKLKGIDECRGNESDIVYPDIIIHKRNTHENLLIVEIKTGSKNHECDIAKLKLFTGSEYQYDFGLFIKFKIYSTQLEWYRNGKKYEEKN